MLIRVSDKIVLVSRIVRFSRATADWGLSRVRSQDNGTMVTSLSNHRRMHAMEEPVPEGHDQIR